MAFVEIVKQSDKATVPVKHDGAAIVLMMRRFSAGAGKNKGTIERPLLLIALGATVAKKLGLTRESGARLYWGEGPDLGKMKIERGGPVKVRGTAAGALLNCRAFPDDWKGALFPQATPCFVEVLDEAGCAILTLPKGIFAAPLEDEAPKRPAPRKVA